MKFRIEDVLIEPSKIGIMGDGGEKIRMTHKPSGIFVFKESLWEITHLEKERLLNELKRKVENTPVTKLEVIKAENKVKQHVSQRYHKDKEEITKEFMEHSRKLEVEDRVKLMTCFIQLSALFDTLLMEFRDK